MITVTKYICSFCGSEYETEQECTECETSHCSPSEYHSSTYRQHEKYPGFINMLMSDGTLVQYRRNEPIGYPEQPDPALDAMIQNTADNLGIDPADIEIVEERNG